jgi:hypothetical protein
MMGCNVMQITIQEVHHQVTTPRRPTALTVPPGVPASYCQGRGRIQGNIRTYLTVANTTPQPSSLLL